MRKYRKKPVVVEALQWNGWESSSRHGDQADTEIELFVGQHNVDAKDRKLLIWVEKSRAWCEVQMGGWVIREPDGSGFYPCTAEQFEATYEPAELATMRGPDHGWPRGGGEVGHGD